MEGQKFKWLGGSCGGEDISDEKAVVKLRQRCCNDTCYCFLGSK